MKRKEMKARPSFHLIGKEVKRWTDCSLALCDVIEGTDTVDPPLCQVPFLHLETVLFILLPTM